MMAVAVLVLIVGVIILVVGMNSDDDFPIRIAVGFLLTMLGLLLMLNTQHDDPLSSDEIGVEQVNSTP